MAAPQVRFCCGCKTMLVILLIIVIALVALLAAGNVFLDKTIDELGYGDFEIMGYTLDELGLSMLTLRECFSMVKSLNNPNQDDYITNPYSDSDIEEVALLFYGSGITSYTTLATEQVYLNESYITLKDTNLAYVLNSVLKNVVDEYQELNNINMNILQSSIYKLNGEYIMSIGASIAMPESSELLSTLFTEDIYIVSNYTITADETGVLSLVPASISVNGISATTVIESIFEAFADESDNSNVESFCDYLGSFISTVVGNIGSVAEVTTDDNGNILSATYGTSGISDSKLSLVSHTKD